jgi:hypothetical protein
VRYFVTQRFFVYGRRLIAKFGRKSADVEGRTEVGPSHWEHCLPRLREGVEEPVAYFGLRGMHVRKVRVNEGNESLL